MKLKGILDFSLGNFLCLRGFAPMGDLYDVSEPDPSFQRDLLKYHEKEMVDFLREGEFLFFPEVILCAALGPEPGEKKDEALTDTVRELYRNVRSGVRFSNLKFVDYKISCTVSKTKNANDARTFDFYKTGTLDVTSGSSQKFSRIDGNHRLSATPKDKKFREHNTPFCLLLFQNPTEEKRFSRALFHNIKL